MPTLRRLTALLSGLLLLQVTLFTGSRSCDVHASPVGRGVVASAGDHEAHDASPVRTPMDRCDLERAAGDCATMPSCVTTLTIPAGMVAVVAHALASDVLPEPVAIHSRPALGPDVPPPRG